MCVLHSNKRPQRVAEILCRCAAQKRTVRSVFTTQRGTHLAESVTRAARHFEYIIQRTGYRSRRRRRHSLRTLGAHLRTRIATTTRAPGQPLPRPATLNHRIHRPAGHHTPHGTHHIHTQIEHTGGTRRIQRLRTATRCLSPTKTQPPRPAAVRGRLALRLANIALWHGERRTRRCHAGSALYVLSESARDGAHWERRVAPSYRSARYDVAGAAEFSEWCLICCVLYDVHSR